MCLKTCGTWFVAGRTGGCMAWQCVQEGFECEHAYEQMADGYVRE